MSEGAALERVLESLRAAGKVPKKLDSGGYAARCPAHEDRRPSLSVDAKNGKAVLCCHARCDVADILSALGLSYPDLFDEPLPDKARRSTRRTLREFTYPDAAGRLTGIATRQGDRNGGGKSFLPLKPNPDGSWDLGASEEFKVTPYRLPELVAAIARGETIFIAEGERDADTLIDRCGVAATSNAGGAGKWKEAHAYWLRGADVVICQDRDTAKGPAQSKAGERHTEVVLATLRGVAASVRVVEPRPPHKDVTDLIDAGGTLADLADVDISRLTASAAGAPETNGHHPPPADGEASPVAVTNGPEAHRGQLRFALRFAGEYAGQLLHAHGIGWHHYRSRWIPCADGFESRAVTRLLGDALRELPELAERERDDLYKDVRRCESAAGIAGILAIAGTLRPIAIAAERLDADPLLLNTASGTVNLETGRSRPHLPGDHITKMTRGEFDPDARSDVFDEFLATIQPDAEMRAFLARSLGSSLIGLVRDHILFIWHGTGANGKSTLRDAVSHALGDYAISVPSDLLLQSKYGHAQMAPERMRLKGARLAFCSEISKGARLDEAIMKDLTGNDKINAKLLYKNPIEFTPSHTLIMLTNHLPQVRGDDPATWRRIMAVPFDTVIPDKDKDLRLPERLRREADAVLAWIWRGWLDYQRDGLAPPGAVIRATDKYKKESDIVARFISDSDAITIHPKASGASAKLYAEFAKWVEAEEGGHVPSQKAFSAALAAKGYEKKKNGAGVMAWYGLALAAPESSDGNDE